MTLKEYQKRAMTTCMSSSDNESYMLFNLIGEVGELCSKIAKQIRKENVDIHYNHVEFNSGFSKAEEELWKKEAGDILWQLSGFCSVMGWELDDIANMNLDKLRARKEVGTIDGSGDGIERGK